MGQGGRVVHAVADHGDHAALGLQPLHGLDLAGRQDLGQHLVDADLGGDRAGHGLVVAGEQHRGQAQGPQLARPPRRWSASPRRRPQHRAGPAVPADRDRGAARGLGAGLARAASSGVRCWARSASSFAPADHDRAARPPRPARPGPRRSRSPRPPAARRSAPRGGRDRPGDRVLARRAPARRPGAAPRPRTRPRRPVTPTSAIAPVVTVPVLSSTIGVDRAGGLQHLGALDQDAELRAAPGADHQRGRRGQAQRAGAGDDQDARPPR